MSDNADRRAVFLQTVTAVLNDIFVCLCGGGTGWEMCHLISDWTCLLIPGMFPGVSREHDREQKTLKEAGGCSLPVSDRTQLMASLKKKHNCWHPSNLISAHLPNKHPAFFCCDGRDLNVVHQQLYLSPLMCCWELSRWNKSSLPDFTRFPVALRSIEAQGLDSLNDQTRDS